MQTMEELKRAQAEAVERLQREHDIGSAQPEAVRPLIKHAHSFKPCPWVTFETKTAAEAINILKAYGPLLDVECRESGSTSIQPAQYQTKQYAEGKLRWTVPQCVIIEQHGGKGFYTSTLSAWVDGAHIKIDFPLAWPLRDNVRAEYDSRDGHVLPHTHVYTQGKLKGHSQRVKYHSELDSFNVRYAFAGMDAVAGALEVQS
jgi:hypothetical protein